MTQVQRLIDLHELDANVVLPCNGLDLASVQVEYVGDGSTAAAWPAVTSPELVVEVSNDGVAWHELDDAGLSESGVSFSANGLKAGIHVTSVQYLRVRVKTAGDTADQMCRVTLYGQRAG